MVLKALFLTNTESFDMKDRVKAYTDIADSCMLLLWLINCHRNTLEEKVICVQQKLLVNSSN